MSELGELVGNVAMRFGMYFRRSMEFADDDDSPLLHRVCEQRDTLLQALRSLDAGKMEAALADTAIVGAARTLPPSPATQRGDGSSPMKASPVPLRWRKKPGHGVLRTQSTLSRIDRRNASRPA